MSFADEDPARAEVSQQADFHFMLPPTDDEAKTYVSLPDIRKEHIGRFIASNINWAAAYYRIVRQTAEPYNRPEDPGTGSVYKLQRAVQYPVARWFNKLIFGREIGKRNWSEVEPPRADFETGDVLRDPDRPTDCPLTERPLVPALHEWVDLSIQSSEGSFEWTNDQQEAFKQFRKAVEQFHRLLIKKYGRLVPVDVSEAFDDKQTNKFGGF